MSTKRSIGLTAGAIACALTLSLAGCGSDDAPQATPPSSLTPTGSATSASSSASTPNETSASSSTDSTPTPEVTAGTSTTPASDASTGASVSKQLTEAQLRAALLTVADMPTGYTAKTPSSSDAKDDDAFCGINLKEPDITVDADFDNDAEINSISTGLGQYSSPAAAITEFTAFKNVLKTCKSDTVEGTTVTISQLPPVAGVGDDQVGLKMAVPGITIEVRFARVGPTVVTAFSGGFVTSDAQLNALFKKQVEKYQKAAG